MAQSYSYNDGKCVATVEATAANQYVVRATNNEKNVSMIMSNPRPYDDAVEFAKRLAGVTESVDYDDLEMYLSERQGW